MTLSEAIARYEGYGASSTNRPTRNNNPGNLKFAGQAGATGADPQGFAIFSSPAAGWQALERQIALDSARGHSLWTFLSKYAPSSENNTSNYAATVAGWLGISTDAPLAAIAAGSPGGTSPSVYAQAQAPELDPLPIAAALVGAAALFSLI